MFDRKSCKTVSKPLHDHAVIEKELYTYQVCMLPDHEDLEQLNDVVAKILQLLETEHITYKTAMQIPAALRSALSLSFKHRMENTITDSLFYNRNDQRNNGNDKGKD